MSRGILAPLLLVAAILAGCGEAEPARPDAGMDRAAIQDRVAAYVGAMLAGDGEVACGQLTPEYRRDTDERAKAGGIAGCAEAMALYGEAVDDVMPKGFAERASDPRLVQVTLKGDRAEAAMRSPRGGLSIKRTSLRRVGARWLIDSLGVTRPRN